jgi:HK97 family phage prohead protease
MRHLLQRKDGAAFKGEVGHALDLDVKDLTTEGEFEGYASTFGNVDQGSDIVVSGAFAESLRKRPAPKVKMLLYHDTRRPCGVWSEMVEDSKGLKVRGRLLLSTDDGKNAYELMRAGALDAMSIGYRVLTEEYDRQTGVRKLLAVDLMEVSVVTFPMNERATISTVKTGVSLTNQDLRELEAVLRDGGLSRTDAVKAISGFKTWLQRDAAAPGEGPRDEVSPGDLAAVRAAFEGLAARIRA